MARLSSAGEPIKESFVCVTLGIMLNIGRDRDRKVLNDEAFTILVLMALTTTFMTTHGRHCGVQADTARRVVVQAPNRGAR